tara:strand:- start:13559 stop:14371 length:813 start_codon:yes stop_codon:yes gene_type:complete
VVIGVSAVVGRLDQRASASGVAQVDVTRVRLHERDTFVADAWREHLDRVLLQTEIVDVRRPEQVDDLVAQLESLSFVAEVGKVETLWPDGLSFPLRFRRPVACLRVGTDYLPVADDGTVLSGYSYRPLRIDGIDLPVLGPHPDPDSEPLPGDVIVDGPWLDALSVAVSLRDLVGSDERKRLGPFLIDASKDVAYDDMPGGVELHFEGRRKVLWGRPVHDAPSGELPAGAKWMHVVDGRARSDRGEAWDLLDARWDVADYHLRPANARGRD